MLERIVRSHSSEPDGGAAPHSGHAAPSPESPFLLYPQLAHASSNRDGTVASHIAAQLTSAEDPPADNFTRSSPRNAPTRRYARA